ncbi:TetR/AcrR family transcriptional regulator [Actinacidiphila alni]|uniref:TetR/AcrR family transcriptional regulator n=1 Tax=Actinacidiphila alni TaxID=380248 RepID=UPI003455BE46
MTGTRPPGGAPARPGLLAHPTTPRSLRVHDAALRAAAELLAEGGLPATTMDAVVARSGVSKATLYKHWPSRTALAAEAFGLRMADAAAPPDTGSARGDLTEHLRQVSALYAGDHGLVFSQLLAACVTDPGAGSYFREFFLQGRRDAVAELWRRALERGEADPAIDGETAIDLLFGPLVFRLMAGHLPLTRQEADRIAAAALGGLLHRPPP